jgi:hypothetical protein
MKSSKGKASYREIRALTIRQPFPELILRRRKPYEIRSWRTIQRSTTDPLSSEDQEGLCKRIGAQARDPSNECFRRSSSFVGRAPIYTSRFQAPKPEEGNRWLVAPSIFLGTEKADPVCSSDQGKRKAWTVHGSSFRRETCAATLAKAEDKHNRRRLSANHTK